MDNQLFISHCKSIVTKYVEEHLDKRDNNPGINDTDDDVFVVWNAKVLQNNKVLLITTLSDGMYYEITYNGDKDEYYLDAYKKWENRRIKM